MSDLSHESREVLRLHTEALNNFTAQITDLAFKVEHGNLFYDLSDTVETFRDSVRELSDIQYNQTHKSDLRKYMDAESFQKYMDSK